MLVLTVLTVFRREGKNVHHVVDLVHREAIVHALHGLAGLVHGIQGFLVNVGGLDRIDMLLELDDLILGLFEVLLVHFLSPEGGLGDCSKCQLVSLYLFFFFFF